LVPVVLVVIDDLFMDDVEDEIGAGGGTFSW